jgi:hypothetical protein
VRVAQADFDKEAYGYCIDLIERLRSGGNVAPPVGKYSPGLCFQILMRGYAMPAESGQADRGGRGGSLPGALGGQGGASGAAGGQGGGTGAIGAYDAELFSYCDRLMTPGSDQESGKDSEKYAPSDCRRFFSFMPRGMGGGNGYTPPLQGKAGADGPSIAGGIGGKGGQAGRGPGAGSGGAGGAGVAGGIGGKGGEGGSTR